MSGERTHSSFNAPRGERVCVEGMVSNQEGGQSASRKENTLREEVESLGRVYSHRFVLPRVWSISAILRRKSVSICNLYPVLNEINFAKSSKGVLIMKKIDPLTNKSCHH